MARARQTPVVSDDEIERRAIRGYYQRLLAGGNPLPEGAPVDVVGPVWSRREGRWELPERTIALDAMVWASQWLRGPDGGPWRFAHRCPAALQRVGQGPARRSGCADRPVRPVSARHG